MIIRIETQWTTYTTEFINKDIGMEQIAEAIRGMLLSVGFGIETINEYIKIDDDL
jgi:uncharacterized Fe-S cluster-containing MiaB family protein